MKFGRLRVISVLLLATAIYFYAPSARAALVTWTLDGVTFADGSLATGSFNFDADGGLFSGVNVTTIPGAPLLSLNYDRVGSGSSSTFVGLESGPIPAITLATFDLALLAAMTDAGGTIGLDLTASGETLPTPPGGVRTLTAGSIIGAPAVVPLPAALPLFLSGLVVFALVARRRRSRGSRAPT